MARKDDILSIYTKEVEGIKEAGLFKGEAPFVSPQGARVKMEDGRELLCMCANNYLGLGDNPRLIEAAKRTYDEKGYGVASVRFVCGTQDIHKKLEKKISGFLGTDDTILYSSCFDANGGLFETILTAEDAVISDELNHASIIDGVRLCKAKRFRYKNNDMEDLEAKLKEADEAGARIKLIATDGVFSMDGIICNLKGVCDLADKYNALVMVDDSHAVGFVGKNGSGKSTLMKIIAGLEKNYQGEVVFSPGYSVGYLAQEPHLDDTKTVKEVVMEGVQNVVDTLAEYEEINNKFGLPEYYEDPEKMDALFARQAELQDIIDATDAWNLDSKLERAMDALRCPPEDQPVKNLSGGERRRVALCRLLLQKPDILLLDEPTNHLDAESIDWLEQHLQQYEGTVIAVTHDRYFLDHVAGWILELDRGEGIPWKGNYSSWLEQKTKRMEMEEKTASKRRKTLERELEWVRMAPKARQAKGKARLNSYDKLLNEDVKEKEEKLEIFIPNGPRLGNKVIEAKHVAKAYGDKLLFDDLNFMLPPNGIVGVIGPNGAGKTTLFRLIMGLEKVDKGEFEVGETVKVAYVDQQHKDIDPNKTVYQVISGGNDLIRMGNRDVNARAYLSRFNFSGSDQEKLCGMLSGGERNRLHLAMALKEEGNVLLLDEPTNDIDVNTLRALEEGLEDFAGCAVVISHDRWFLDRICTHILAFEGNSEVFFFEGSYTEYEENKMKRMGNVEPKRVRYRKLMED